jgi:peptidoglycan/xylan/chitin deacetylase (PgdA/CDA1 family)
MKIRGVKTIQRMVRWLRSRFVNGGLILLYHRIAEPAYDPFSLCVSPRHFVQQLEFLRRNTHPMSLPNLLQAVEDNNLPPRAIALTFDDGYADVLYQAKPLLEEYQIPATVFVATGYLGGKFWWDELSQLLLEPKTLPRQLSISINGNTFEWTLRNNNVHSARHRLLHALHRQLRPLSPEARQQVMAQIAAWVAPDAGNNIARPLSPTELLDLAKGDLIAVGAHTVTHPPLASLSITEQHAEILQSKTKLETLLGESVSSFSYPYGLDADFTTETMFAVQEAGFSCACTNIVDVVWTGSDLFQLSRLWVQNWDSHIFTQRLERWF